VVAGGWRSQDETILCAELDVKSADDKRVGGLSDIHADRRSDLYPSGGWVGSTRT
jgi:5-aminopentanamidase